MYLTVNGAAHAGQRVALPSHNVVVGRDPSCDIVLNDTSVSRRHLLLESHDAERVLVRDLGSANGTSVNGQPLVGPILLRANDTIGLGSTMLTLGVPDEPAVAPAAAPPNGHSDTVVPQLPVSFDQSHGSPRPEDSVIIRLRRSVRRSTWLAVGALLVLLALPVGFFSGFGPFATSQASIEDIVDAATPSTVIVGTATGQGSGWVYDAEDGLIVTNHHVIAGGTDFHVGVDGEARPASLVGTVPCEDLAVLQVDDVDGLQAMELARQDDLRLGQTVVALGYPDNGTLRGDLTATTGVVSIQRTSLDGGFDVPDYPNIVQTDTAINPGNSGGPLVDSQMRLVGVNAAGRTTNESGEIIQGQNFAIGVDRVRQVVPDLVDGRSHAWTGALIDVVPSGAELARHRLPSVDGMLVTGAVPGTQAARAGLEDTTALLVAVDGNPMDGSLPGYCDAVGRSRSGDEATFTLVPAGTRQAVDLRLRFE